MADSNRDKVVYFVRHGQSEDNVAPVFQSPHSPLSAVGRQQAERIAERVSHLSFDALLASPYQRAKETADAIGKVTGKAPELCRALYRAREANKHQRQTLYRCKSAEDLAGMGTQSVYARYARRGWRKL